MAINDLLSDMLARIKNGQRAHLAQVTCPYSNLLANVLRVLESEGYIRGWSEIKEDGRRSIEIQLKYFDGVPVIKSLKRVSKPGRRFYSSLTDLQPVSNGLGVAILSTNKGVISDADAHAHKVGGEILCHVF
jgi:small subunit ribosomal protein S8